MYQQPKVSTTEPLCVWCCAYGNLLVQPLILPDLNWFLNFMHWPRGTIKSIRLSTCRQFDRLEAELSHGSEGPEDERTAEASRRESKAKLGQEPGHLGLVPAPTSAAAAAAAAAVELLLLRGIVESLRMSDSELMGKKERGKEEKEEE